jgi:hypothetical protein
VITAGVYAVGGVLTILSNPRRRLAFRRAHPFAPAELSESPARPV